MSKLQTKTNMLVAIGSLCFTGLALTAGVCHRTSVDRCQSCTLTMWDATKDPMPGDVPIDPRLLPKHLQTSLFCVITGGCQSCALAHVGYGKDVRSSNLPLILLVPGPKNNSESPSRELGAFTSVITLDKSTFERINPSWFPRGLVLGSDGQVVALQKNGEPMVDFVKRVRK